MDNVENLAKILTRINEGESPAKLREGAEDFLATVEPGDIVRAQQRMLRSGVDIKEISRMCRSHIGLIGHPAEKLRFSLPQGHVLQRLLAEHQMVQCLLVDLSKLNTAISRLPYISATAPEYTRLLHIVSHLAAGEQHTQMEETVLFPELEKLGMSVLPTILTAEHFDLQYYTQQLQELIYKCCAMDFTEFKRGLDRVVLYFVPLKQEHIFKEDNMLYPIAFGVVNGDAAWNRLYSACEQIGYCCF
ncbi:MAG TPA: DUF438 domain-containing protein [Sedimentisphaerales bacterium]|nr:DUF438 domain-containing protein [Sedimentisphaerales bacterium]